jgi:polyhydroxyalkanoate synthesis regulator phasin
VSRVDDVRRTIEGLLGTLTPAKAQQLAKGMLEPGARKDQVAKAAGELVEWSQKNRERMRELIRKEIRDQLQQVGVAPQSELDALKKRVRELERAAGKTASGRTKRSGGATKSTARSSAAKKTTAKAED